MYDFTDSSESDFDLLQDVTSFHIHAESEREWSRMSDQFINAGYREGITAGKESALQEGFDTGFADIGAPIGRELGNLRGLAAGALSFAQSSRSPGPQREDRDELIEEVRSIIGALACLQFANLAAPDDEALAHAREHAELSGGDSKLPTDLTAAVGNDLPELSVLREKLEEVLKAFDFGPLLHSPEYTA